MKRLGISYPECIRNILETHPGYVRNDSETSCSTWLIIKSHAFAIYFETETDVLILRTGRDKSKQSIKKIPPVSEWQKQSRTMADDADSCWLNSKRNRVYYSVGLSSPLARISRGDRIWKRRLYVFCIFYSYKCLSTSEMWDSSPSYCSHHSHKSTNADLSTKDLQQCRSWSVTTLDDRKLDIVGVNLPVVQDCIVAQAAWSLHGGR